jgi:hypothetical protein
VVISRRIEKLEEVEFSPPLEWERRVNIAGRISRRLDNVPLERIAAMLAEGERRASDGGNDDPAQLMAEFLDLNPADVRAVLGDGHERDMELWEGCWVWVRARLDNPEVGPTFVHALRRERLRRGLPPGAGENWRELVNREKGVR